MSRKVIGVTGTAGSGKTLLTRFLAAEGAVIIDVDGVGHEVLDEIKEQLVESFGDGIISDGEVSREKLGELVFSDITKLHLLNSMVHPRIKEKIREKLRKFENDGIVLLDAALLFKIGLDEFCDKVVCVRASKWKCFERLKERCSDPRRALKIITLQDDEEIYKHCDIVVLNNGTKKKLKEKAREIWRLLVNQ